MGVVSNAVNILSLHGEYKKKLMSLFEKFPRLQKPKQMLNYIQNV